MRWPWKRTEPDERLTVAQDALRRSLEERAHAQQLAQELRQLRSENHITERIHRAMRGGERQ